MKSHEKRESKAAEKMEHVARKMMDIKHPTGGRIHKDYMGTEKGNSIKISKFKK